MLIHKRLNYRSCSVTNLYKRHKEAKMTKSDREIVRRSCPDDTMEDVDFCGYCDASHWPSDEDEWNSTWQQWKCEECNSWNDKQDETPPRKDVTPAKN